MEKKAEARRRIRKIIRRMTLEERRAKSEAMRTRLRELPELREARVLMGFLPMPDEVDTQLILADLGDAGKRLYVPRTFVREKRMIPVRLSDLRNLRAGGYDIPEPDTDESCNVEEIDFIFVPARAYDRRGNRLGRGAGFYDRFMATEGFHATRCGIAFACQVLDAVPHTTHDLSVEILVTEDETLRFGSQQQPE